MKLDKYKKADSLSYTFGAYPTLELIEQKPELLKLVLIRANSGENEGVQKIVKYCDTKGITVSENNREIEKLSKKGNVYALGVFEKYESKLNGSDFAKASTDKNEDHLALVEPSDMGNMGTIIRTMLGFGVKNLAIIGEGVDVFHPNVIRSSMGAVFKINFEYFAKFDDYLAKYKNNLYSFMTNGEVNLPEVKFEKPFTLIFGNEGKGLSDYFKTVATIHRRGGASVTIPQSKEIDSLNLAMSVGIALYESSKNS